MSQNRQPAGIPIGGEFAATAHSDTVDTLQRPVIDEMAFTHEDAPFEIERDGEGRYTIYSADGEGDEIASFTFDGDATDRAALEASAVSALARQRKRLAAVSTPGRRVLWIDPDGDEVHEGAVTSTKGEIITVALDSGGEAEVFANELMPGWTNPPALEGGIPAPRPDQTYLDGTPVAGDTFDAAYAAFFRPLQDYEAEHGEWMTTRAPSESTLLEFAGLGSTKMGSVHGVFLEADEKTGEPLVEVHTRNPGYCYSDDCDGDCDACLEDGISDLPGFVRTTNDDGDVSHFFRPSDPAAAQRYLADKKTRDLLNVRLYARDAIAAGKQPPWAILSPVRERARRSTITGNLSQARKEARDWTAALAYTDKVTAAVDAGGPLPEKPLYELYPQGAVLYDMHREAVTKQTAEAATAKTQAAQLQAELRQGLPPAAAALVEAEQVRLETAAADALKKAKKARASLVNDVENLRAWATRRHAQGDQKLAALASTESALRDFDWSFSWPGDPKDCPPAPAAE